MANHSAYLLPLRTGPVFFPSDKAGTILPNYNKMAIGRLSSREELNCETVNIHMLNALASTMVQRCFESRRVILS
jgi:hypothetical protein